MVRTLVPIMAVAALLMAGQDTGLAQRAGALQIRASSAAELRSWDAYVTLRERSGALRVTSAERDPDLPDRTIERLQQFHEGVPIWGANVVRDVARGVVQSMFGSLSSDLALSSAPTLSVDDAQARLAARADTSLLQQPALIVLPLDSGEHRLAYMAVVATGAAVDRVFIDAHSGAELLRYSEIETQAAVGTGVGVLGDTKKVSALKEADVFFTDDQLRPPLLRTFDMRGNLPRVFNVLDGALLFASDRATDADNVWGDVAAVDAHTHIGWTYDYYFKRHGRRGLDNRDRQVVALINGLTQQGAVTVPESTGAIFAINAFWCGSCGPNAVGLMYFGNGLPPGFYEISSGQSYTYLAGSLDVIAHELTHGVIDSSSNFSSQNEPGALNEAFADMMGTAVEAYYQPAGTGLRQADYLIGEDTIRGVTTTLNGLRSLSDPAAYGDPDHYSRRNLGAGDDGGVHTNSAIPSHAYYLAIEGGTNRTSGLAVQGVGAANREQIEKVFYRAFVLLLPANATFATARAATIQAARDIYGAASAAERAVTQAWTAVGVN